MEHGDLRAVYVVGENPAQGEADQQRAVRLLEGLDHLVVQDIFLTATAQLADVVLPAASTLAEAEGTVTSSERRVQRVRKAIEPPGEARDDVAIVYELARRMGSDLGSPKAEDVWNELRVLSPMHRGMSYERLEDLGGIQWPCGDEDDPGTQFLHGTPVGRRRREPRAVPGGRARSAGRPARRRLPAPPDHRPPARVVQHRCADRRLLVPAPRRRRGAAARARGRSAVRRRRRRPRARRLAARLGRGAGALRPDAAARARVHEPPFPRPRGDERAHDRRDRPEVGDGGVQGHGDPPGGRSSGHPPAHGRAERRGARGDRRRRRAGRRERAPRRARRPRPPPPAAAGAPCGAAARRLGERGRARLRLPPARRASGGRVRRRQLLRADLPRGASRRRDARLHRPRLPARRRQRPGGRSSEPVPRAVRARARRAADDRRPGAARDPAAGARAGAAAGRADRGSGCSAASRPASIRSRSTRIARTAATRRSTARSSSAATASSTRWRSRICSAAAAPRSRPARSGRRSRASRRSRTTSSATPTSRSRARSRTGC